MMASLLRSYSSRAALLVGLASFSFALVPAPVSAQAVPAVTLSIRAGSHPRDVAADPQTGRAYVVNERSRDISVIDLDTRSKVATFGTPFFSPMQVAVDPTTHELYVTDYLDRIAILNPGTGSTIAVLRTGTWPRGTDFDPTLRRAYVANTATDDVTVIDTAARTVVATVPVGDKPQRLVVDAGSHLVFVGNYGSKSVSVIDGITNAVDRTIALPGPPIDLDLDTSRNRLYVGTQSFPSAVFALEVNTGTILAQHDFGSGACCVTSIALDAQRMRLIVSNGSTGMYVRVFSADDLSVIRAVELCHPGPLAIIPARGEIYVANMYSDAMSILEQDASAPPIDVEPPTSAMSWNVQDERVDETGRRWTSSGFWAYSGCFDALSGCFQTETKVNGQPTYGGHTTIARYDEGSYNVTAKSVDCAGNWESSTAQLRVGIDRTVPVGQIDNPDNSVVVSIGSAVPLIASAADGRLPDGSAGSGVDALCFDMVQIDPVSGQATPRGCHSAIPLAGDRWRGAPDVPGGRYRVTAVVTDLVGNLGRSSSVSVLLVNA